MKRVLVAAALLAAAAFAWWRLAPEALPEFAQRAIPRSPVANPPLYKWRDAQGRWHVTDAPPADRPYETIVVDPGTNVVPAYGSEPDERAPPD
ncbi:MAG TPA: DUF4124 domain-containing protein [Candidatus Saccharimonadia bacterium]|nr:DUF4124 domain-containing protein [Candidatus Saccharimonadia bacterium]